MKARIALSLLLLTLAVDARAQWSVGGIADRNPAAISLYPGQHELGHTSRLAFAIGFLVDYAINDRGDLHTQLSLLAKRITMEDEAVGWKSSYMEHMSWCSSP